jgi:DNA recombination protein RmuC
MEFIYLLTGLAIGAIVSWLIANTQQKAKLQVSNERASSQANEIETLKQVNDEKVSSLNHEIEFLKKEINLKEASLLEVSKNLAARDSDYIHLSVKLNEQKSEIEKLQEKFSIEFRNLANDILDEKTKKFTEQNKTNLDLILKPLSDKIKDFEKKVEETYDKESQQRFSLKEEVKRLAELSLSVKLEANNLTRALKGESKTQGNWGEVILESILERSGLSKDREYFIQKSFNTEEGRRLQPDVVVVYPGERSIIVDSKVSLTAYERYVSALSPEEQESAIKEHLTSVKRHIDELSAKGYQTLYDLKSLDFVMMFMPIEPAYMIAVQSDPGLWNYAYDKRILLISPTNLIAALKMVESMWRQEYQNKNAEEIARQSGALYDKFEGLVNDLIELGKRLNSTQEFYKSSMNKITDGKGSIIGRIENIRKLGAKTKKTLPQNLLNRIEDEEESTE